jgi:putative peptidoglycan lipid II flippase
VIKRLFSGQINSITVAALLVALSSLLSRFLGIFRDSILASEFGAGDTLDIYFTAFRVPDLIFNLLVLGAMSAGFIPIFTSLINGKTTKLKEVFSGNKYKEAWVLASSIMNLMAIAIFTFSIIAVIFAPYLVKLIAPGFSPEKQILTANLTRIMFLSPLFLGISSIFGGILQSFKRFFVYSLSPIMYNIGIIIGALYFVPIWGVYGLAWGVVLGAFFHMMIQLPIVFKLGFKYSFVIELKSKNVRKIMTMMVPRVMSLGISQINLVVITIIASTLASGSLAIFNYANNLQAFPVSIFGISLAVAAFPTLSTIAFNRKKMTESFSSLFRQILFFIVPSTVLLLTLRAQIVRVIYGRGQFDWTDTLLTMDTLAFFTISLFAQASLPLLVRMFYARHDSKTPFFAGLFCAVLNVVLSLLFIEKYGVSGLALAFSISTIINFVILWLVLLNELGSMDELRILKSSVIFSIGAVASGTVIQLSKVFIHPYIDMTKFSGVLLQGAYSGITGILVYLLICHMLRSEEQANFFESIRKRLPFRKVDTGDHGEARGI